MVRRRHEEEAEMMLRWCAQHREPYEVEVAGVVISVLPGVFSPLCCADSEWFATNLPSLVNDGRLLEVGTGTGIIALLAALGGARVSATDISAEAVRNARLNFSSYGFVIPVYHGDLFSPVPAKARFDFIFWNHPFCDASPPSPDALYLSGFDEQYASLRSFFAGAKHHLAPGGKVLLGSSSLADEGAVASAAAQNGFSLEVLLQESFSTDEEVFDLRIYCCSPKGEGERCE